MVSIVTIEQRHIEGFHAALDSVCRERRYLARYEAPPLEAARGFVLGNIRNGTPQFLAVEEGRVVGWCDISLSSQPVFGHCGTLGMGVIAGCRGRGIGTQLLKAALARAKEIGLERVELEVFESNAAAVALYRKMGFVIEGRKIRSAKIDGRYENDLIMARLFGGTHGS